MTGTHTAGRPQAPRLLVVADQLSGGAVGRTIAEARAAGRTYPGIAALLETRHGVVVSREAVRRWIAATETQAA
jgi:hypothetical protein